MIATTPALADIFAARYQPSRLPFASPRTLGHYRGLFSQFSEHLGHPATLADLNDATVGAFLASFMVRKCSPYYVDQRRQYLLAFWRWAFRHKLLDNWPEVASIARPELSPDSWSVDQLRRLLAACRTWPGPNASRQVPRTFSGVDARAAGKRFAESLGIEVAE